MPNNIKKLCDKLFFDETYTHIDCFIYMLSFRCRSY